MMHLRENYDWLVFFALAIGAQGVVAVHLRRRRAGIPVTSWLLLGILLIGSFPLVKWASDQVWSPETLADFVRKLWRVGDEIAGRWALGQPPAHLSR